MSCTHDCNQGRSCECGRMKDVEYGDLEVVYEADSAVLVSLAVVCAIWFALGVVGLITIVKHLI